MKKKKGAKKATPSKMIVKKTPNNQTKQNKTPQQLSTRYRKTNATISANTKTPL